MDKPFAITLDVGSSLANKTGSWRTERPVYVDRLPPCNDACPAGEDIQALAVRTPRSGRLRGAPGAQIMEDNPFPAVMGRVCYHPCETACNRGQLDEAVGINSVERFLGDEAIRAGLDGRRRRAADRQARARRRRRPVRAVGGVPPARGSATRSTIRDAGPQAGGMMRFGIPRTGCRATCSTPRSQRILDLGVTLELERQGRRPRRRCARAASTRPSSPSARTSASAPTSRPASAAHDPRRGRRCCAAWRARSRRCSAAASPSTAAATPRWTRPAPPSGSAPTEAVVVYRRTRDRMPAHDFEVEEADRGGRPVQVAVDDQARRRRPARRRADGARRDRLPAADRRARGARGRLAGARARPGHRPRRCSSGVPGRRASTTASCRSART